MDGGTVLIGVGGLLTTLGWNTLTSRDQQRNAILALAREVELNQKLVEAAIDLAARWPTRGESENFSYQFYESTQVSAVLTSGALDPRDARDTALADALEQYQRALADFNAGLRNVGRHNPSLFIKVDLIPIKDAKLWPGAPDQIYGDLFRQLLHAHRAVRLLLGKRVPSTARRVIDRGREAA